MQQWLSFLGGALIALGVIGAGGIIWTIDLGRTPFFVPFDLAIITTQVIAAGAAFLSGAIPGSLLLALSAILGRLDQISLDNQQLLRLLENNMKQVQDG